MKMLCSLEDDDDDGDDEVIVVKKTSPTKAARKKTVALTSTMALANWIGIVATSANLKKLH